MIGFGAFPMGSRIGLRDLCGPSSPRDALTVHGAQEAQPAHEDLRRVPAAIRMAEDVGTGLGKREGLLGPLPRGGAAPPGE